MCTVLDKATNVAMKIEIVVSKNCKNNQNMKGIKDES